MQLHLTLLTIGTLFLVGLICDEIGRRTQLPRVTLLLSCGIAAGSSGFDLLPDEAAQWYEFLAVSALTMVAFLLGGSLTKSNIEAHGRAILAISTSIVITTLIVVGAGLWMMGFEISLALLLSAIASATAPASTEDVIRQSRESGRFVETLTGIVAIDDAWGLIAFSMVVVIVGTLDGGGELGTVLNVIWEIGGAIGVGAAIGVPAAGLTGRLRDGEPLQAEALGVVFLTAGLSTWLDVSFLIAGMTAGTLIVNFAHHHKSAFHEIEHIEWPFMVLFFVLAGASLETALLADVGLLGLAYVLLRILARIVRGWIGAIFGGVPLHERLWFGPALLPQAGVAVGMALVAGKEFPELSETILTLTIGTTVVFEILGPVVTLYAIKQVAGKERNLGL